MLHNRPYNECWTADIKTAWATHDAAFFKAQVKQLSAIIAARPDDHPVSAFDPEHSRLLICLAALDCIQHHGETTNLILDVVNF